MNHAALSVSGGSSEILSIIFIFLLVSSLNYSNIKKGFQGDKTYQFDKVFVKESG